MNLLDMVEWRATQHLRLIEEVLKEHYIYDHYCHKTDFILAGGCFKSLDRQPGIDYDIFLLKGGEHAKVQNPLVKTENATTIAHNGITVQLCNYSYSSLSACINSFDLSHCRCGVLVRKMQVADRDFTRDWKGWIESGEVVYNKDAKDPFSSLLRAAKIYKQGLININTFRTIAADILGCIEDKGVKKEDLATTIRDNPNIKESETGKYANKSSAAPTNPTTKEAIFEEIREATKNIFD